MPYILGVLSFVETKLFTRLVQEYLPDDEYAALQAKIAADPETGVVIAGSGAVRKLRWRGPGRGKRGGYRVIYFVRKHQGLIWMLTIYPKNVADNIPAHLLNRIRQEIEND
jgi:mRNA-degrading endonuclease RelE of RelBE toxin-antitoxin system